MLKKASAIVYRASEHIGFVQIWLDTRYCMFDRYCDTSICDNLSLSGRNHTEGSSWISMTIDSE